MDILDLAIGPTVLATVLLVIVVLYRRFRRAADDVPWACQAAAAIALSLGALTAITGVGHSMAVASVALSERVPKRYARTSAFRPTC